MIKYIDELKKHIKNRESIIQEKKTALADLRRQLESKSSEIKLKEKEYASTFSDEIFSEIQDLKKELSSLQEQITSIDEKIKLMSVGVMKYDGDVLGEIDEYIKSLKLENAKGAIEKAKKAYIDSINKYIDEVDKINILKREITPLSSSISQGNCDIILGELRIQNKYFIWSESFEAPETIKLKPVLENKALSIWSEMIGGKE